MTKQLSEPQASSVKRRPTRKVGSAAIGGAAATVILWVIGSVGLLIPPEVAAAITTIISFGVAYLIPAEA